MDATNLRLRPTFHSPHEQHGGRVGEPFTLVRVIDTPDERHDEEVLPMYVIRFQDGVEIEAWPDEVLLDAPSEIAAALESIGAHPIVDRPKSAGRWPRPERVTSLDDALEDVQVHGPGAWENDQGPEGWHAVSTGDDGIVAYFQNEADAFRFRLDLINYWLNG